jgi:KDO2-lipid IV(A) lauroyltransferase
MTENWFKKNVEIVNGEYFLDMMSKGSFAITAHFGNWEVMQRFLTLNGKDLSVIYNPIQNPYINKLYLKQRNVSQLPKGTSAMKQLIELIKDKKNVGVVADQRDKSGEVYQFFEKDAKTSTAIQRLSVKYNYPIFCVKCDRKLENPNKFTLTVYPALKTEKENQNEAVKDLTEQSLRVIESWIYERPENWLLWFYSRWRIHL